MLEDVDYQSAESIAVDNASFEMRWDPITDKSVVPSQRRMGFGAGG